MTHQNKAREALEALYYIEECTKYMSSIHPHHFGIVRSALTILERLEGADRVALREAIEDLKSNVSKCGSISDYSDNSLDEVLKAARIIADMGE